MSRPSGLADVCQEPLSCETAANPPELKKGPCCSFAALQLARASGLQVSSWARAGETNWARIGDYTERAPLPAYRHKFPSASTSTLSCTFACASPKAAISRPQLSLPLPLSVSLCLGGRNCLWPFERQIRQGPKAPPENTGWRATAGSLPLRAPPASRIERDQRNRLPDGAPEGRLLDVSSVDACWGAPPRGEQETR